MGRKHLLLLINKVSREKKERQLREFSLQALNLHFFPSRRAPHAVHVHETESVGEKKGHIFPWSWRPYCVSAIVPKHNGICLADLSCRQATSPRLTHGLRSERGRCVATRVGLIKFIPTNEGMTYPVIRPGERGRCFPAPASKHTNLIIMARSNYSSSGGQGCLQKTGRGAGTWD